MKYNTLHEHGFTLKCHRPGVPAPCAFFIQSRGVNIGRPSLAPRPNCFAFICPPEEIDRYHWLVYALWKTGRFAACTHGTLIPMVRIGDIQNIIAAHNRPGNRFQEAQERTRQIDLMEAQLHQGLALARRARMAVLVAALDMHPPATTDP